MYFRPSYIEIDGFDLMVDRSTWAPKVRIKRKKHTKTSPKGNDYTYCWGSGRPLMFRGSIVEPR